MRSDVTFVSDGMNCAGWLYQPDNLKAGEKTPAIVMAHGLTGIKEMYLDPVAKKLEEKGFIVLAFDYRYSGDSEGEPKGRIHWDEQVEDYKNAITYISSLDAVDSDRIGAWGTSYSGAHVIHLGAYDSRVKCVYSQIPALNLYDVLVSFNTPESFEQFKQALAYDRTKRYTTGEVNFFPAVSEDGTNCVMIGTAVYDWCMEAYKTVAPNWINQVTVQSMEKALEYNVEAAIHLVAPKPLMMVVADQDLLTPISLQLRAFGKAGEPKKLHILKGSHFSMYSGDNQKISTKKAADWFEEHLMG